MTPVYAIADMLTRIRNASAQFQAEVAMPHSKMKEAVARILEAEGYVGGYVVVSQEPYPILKIRLKYVGEGNRAKQVITKIALVSKPSRRVYTAKDSIPSPLGGLGICILSTSQGVLSGSESRERGIGGEVLCEVW